MLKKQKSKSLEYYRKKADSLIQELGHQVYDACLVCGGEYSCLHHFVKKSQSSELRYYWPNLIPLCQKCHHSIHNRYDDTVTARITLLMGHDWLLDLMAQKRKGLGKTFGVTYYKNIIQTMPYLTKKYTGKT